MYGFLVLTDIIFNMIEVIDLPLKDAKILRLKRLFDNRGWFTETFQEKWFTEIGINEKFVLEYWSFNEKVYTLRGLHAQIKEYAQSKIVQVLHGSIQDVLVDARKDSPTYGKHVELTLSSTDPYLIYIPKGFYHGFVTLEDNTYVGYKISDYHNPQGECGIKFDSPELNIDWKVNSNLTISNRDQHHPTWNDAYKFEST